MHHLGKELTVIVNVYRQKVEKKNVRVEAKAEAIADTAIQ